MLKRLIKDVDQPPPDAYSQWNGLLQAELPLQGPVSHLSVTFLHPAPYNFLSSKGDDIYVRPVKGGPCWPCLCL